jgi:hypothetical protein
MCAARFRQPEAIVAALQAAVNRYRGDGRAADSFATLRTCHHSRHAHYENASCNDATHGSSWVGDTLPMAKAMPREIPGK